MSFFTEGWRRALSTQWVYGRDNERYGDATVTWLEMTGLWHPAFPPTWKILDGYTDVKDAKAFCEVTVKLCSS